MKNYFCDIDKRIASDEAAMPDSKGVNEDSPLRRSHHEGSCSKHKEKKMKTEDKYRWNRNSGVWKSHH